MFKNFHRYEIETSAKRSVHILFWRRGKRKAKKIIIIALKSHQKRFIAKPKTFPPVFCPRIMGLLFKLENVSIIVCFKKQKSELKTEEGLLIKIWQ